VSLSDNSVGWVRKERSLADTINVRHLLPDIGIRSNKWMECFWLENKTIRCLVLTFLMVFGFDVWFLFFFVSSPNEIIVAGYVSDNMR
jgi:hypothetical protein